MTPWIRKSFAFLLTMSLLASAAAGVKATQVEQLTTYDPATEGIVSSYYEIDREAGFLRGLAPQTQLAELQAVCLPTGLQASSEKLATGTVLSATIPATDPESAATTHSLTAIVTGDLNGDGNATITDMLQLKTFLLGQELSAQAMAAGDLNYDGSVTITDFLQLKSNLLGMSAIRAGWRKSAEAPAQVLLLTPGQVVSWNVEQAASYETSDPQIVVAAEGTITAQAARGTAFVYALDQQGAVVSRYMVTVVEEALSVSLSQKEHRLVLGKTLQLSANKNHPVPTTLTWTSSDTTVATVDEAGLVKGVKPGVAVVSVSLPNGSKAETKITVAVPITAVSTERTLYKIKPGSSKKIPLQLQPAGEEELFTWTSSDPAVAKVSQDGTVTGVKNGTVTITAKGKYSGLSASCKVKVCNVKQVAITFDDGPGRYTMQLLEALKKEDIRVTFFMLGSLIDNYPDTVRKMAADGHELGYHSYDHKQQTGLSNGEIVSEYQKSESVLKSITGKGFTLWRTPGGGYSERVLSQVPLPHIMWSVDTMDWKTLSADATYQHIINYSRDGSIVLMHDIHGSTVTGAIRALKEMQAGDYEFVTVTELLSRDGTPPQAGKTYFYD